MLGMYCIYSTAFKCDGPTITSQKSINTPEWEQILKDLSAPVETSLQI